ncbi:MAG: hypothetical protein WD771_10725 [Gemmatimonadaceae bacterium]
MAIAFRDRCLKGSGSLLFPSDDCWTIENLQRVWTLFVENPDLSDRSFYEKIQDQLGAAPEGARRVAVDAIAFYFLFPDTITASKKFERLTELIAGLGIESGADLSAVRRAFDANGIGGPGTYYSTGVPWNFAFIIGFAIEAKTGEWELEDPESLASCADKASARLPQSTQLMKNATKHLLIPDYFERIASDGHRNLVLERYVDLASTDGSVDSRLLAVRRALEKRLGRTDFDFYDPDLKAEWGSDGRPGETIDVPTGDVEMISRRVFVEKSRVKGRPDRLSGPHALGKALWSPQRSKNGGDIYRFMREVRSGDVVLHITDNEGITGISIADAAVDDKFRGVDGTEWAQTPSYRISLREFHKLEPPLHRSVMFGEPASSQLVALLDGGLQHVFFNREPSFNQGHYLTPAPVSVLQVLNAAYRRKTGRDLVPLESTDMPAATPGSSPQKRATALALASDSFSEALRSSGIVFGERHAETARTFVSSLATKRFVILTGLSGSGKTQLAIKFGQWLGGEQYIVLPVRPDWTGSEALFGYEDALQPARGNLRAWHAPAALQFILKAAGDPARPYLLVLDEMNLAHVERYFAEMLSGMESDERVLPNLKREPDGHWRISDPASPLIPVPKNLFVVGTVNIDETTYMFSPKVLDRANTIEFRVPTEALGAPNTEIQPAKSGNSQDVTAFLSSASKPIEPQSEGTAEFSSRIRSLHALLTEHGFEFGHRSFREMHRFAALYLQAGGGNAVEALDLQVMQKVLPRIFGARRQMEPLLLEIARFCIDPDAFADGPAAGVDPTTELSEAPLLPRTFDKVRRMIVLARQNQYVGFTD